MDKKDKSEEDERGYDFSKAISKQKQFKFGSKDSNTVTVDMSLANLFQRLTVECSGILGNPQWKHFRHMELLKTEQIRLSNGIWRSWHMHFQLGVKPRFCTFEIDPRRDEICHSQPQGIVLEGKYWNRTNSAVAMEYRKWRIYAKQKTKWSSIRRIPNVSTTSHNTMQLGEPQAMQTDTTEFKLSQIFQAIDDFPESLLMDMSRPGDDRLYMRPLVESAEIIQQPYLGMLNPHIDEMAFEPMEVMFPSLGLPGRFSNNPAGTTASYYPPSHASGLEQQPPTNTRLPPGTANDPQPYSTPAQLQYENQSPYVNIPQQTSREFPQASSMSFNMDPASYLNMPVDPRLHPQPDVMDIGTPPIQSMMKPATTYNSSQTTPTTPYATPTQTFLPGGSAQPGDDKITSLITQFISEEPAPVQITPPTDTKPPSQSAAARFDQHQPYIDTEQPLRRFEGDKSELEMQQMLAMEMKRMEEEHLEKIKQLEHQQQIASRQYLTLLQEYVRRSGSQRPSQQQQEVLMSVLSDPMSLGILKEILKDDSLPSPDHHMGVTPTLQMTPHYQVKKETTPSSYTPQVTPPTTTPVISPPASVPPPTNIEMDTTVSDFQSRLIMAAAAQATLVDTPSSNTFQPIQPKEGQSFDGSSSITSLLATPTGGNDTGNLDMPPSPSLIKKFKNVRNLTPDEKKVYQELRRQSHITAEQRRRGSIKSGFDQLQSLVINPASFPSGKISKATILEKTIEHIQGHHQERDGRSVKMKKLKEEMKELNEAILRCQEELPASGAPVTRQVCGRDYERFEENRQMFMEYIRQRTQHNYKFWIYSIIIQQLFDSYNSMVSTSSIEELRQTVLSWFEQSCSLPSLRPIVMSSLRELSMKTSLSKQLPEQHLNEPNPTS